MLGAEALFTPPRVEAAGSGSLAAGNVPLVMFAAFVASVVADAAKFTPLVFVQVIAPALESVQSPDMLAKAGSGVELAIRNCPAVGAEVEATVVVPV